MSELRKSHIDIKEKFNFKYFSEFKYLTIIVLLNIESQVYLSLKNRAIP